MLVLIVWQLPSLPGGLPPSTIGVRRLNFCVRYGNRCIPSAIVTRYSIYCFYLFNSIAINISSQDLKFSIH